MSISVHVKNGQQAIVPIRFSRAVTGGPVRNSPDVDDRAFSMGARTATWGSSPARGSQVAITEGDTVRIKILREDIEAGAELYVSSTDPSVIEIVTPVGGDKVPNDNIIQIKGVVDKANAPVCVQIHYGSQDGPVIGELEPHVFAQIRLRLAMHFVNLEGGDTARWNADPATLQANSIALVNQVNDIWRPVGVELRSDNMQLIRDQIRRNPANPARSQYLHSSSGTWRSMRAPLGVAGNFTTPGTITDNSTWGNAQYREFDTMIRLNFVRNHVNVYCVQNGTGWVGLSYVGDNRGLAIDDRASNFDFAHELGHYLNLVHADENAAGNDADNKENWLLRRLMYSDWPPVAPPHRNNVGYGSGQYGALISVKKLPGDYTGADGEVAKSRRRARNPFS